MSKMDVVAEDPSPEPSPRVRGEGDRGEAAVRVRGEGERIVSPAEPVPDEFDLLCEGCGYSLVGLSGERCPECGEGFDPNELPLARVPWLFRRRYGAVWAYVKTVWMVVLRPGRFA